MTNGHINPANVPDIALKDGHSIPQVGLGMLRIDDEGVVPVVESALEAGYRHIDGAAGYNNEAGVGRALAASGYNKGTKRETLWVTTKLRDSQQGYDSALKAFDNSLKLLQLDYVDMYMIHWPTPFDWRSTDTWKAFVKLRDEGMARTLGVCNFMPADLKRLHEETGAWPAVERLCGVFFPNPGTLLRLNLDDDRGHVVARLFLLGEIEHRAVAFDVYQAVYGDDQIRRRMMRRGDWMTKTPSSSGMGWRL